MQSTLNPTAVELFRRNWGLVLAIALAAIIASFLWTELEPTKPSFADYGRSEPSGGAGYYPGGASCDPQILSTIRDNRVAVVERNRCAEAAEENRIRRADLAQQLRAADAAQTQAWTNYELAKMALAGTVGGFLTLIAASLAAFYARQAAKAGRETVEAFVAVERARLVIVPSGFSHTPKDAPKAAVSISATNVGKGTCVVTGFTSTFVEGPEFSRVKVYMGGITEPVTIQPNETKCLQSWSECDDIDKKSFLRGVATYKDAFSTRKSFFCFRIQRFSTLGSSEERWWKEIRDDGQPADT